MLVCAFLLLLPWVISGCERRGGTHTYDKNELNKYIVVPPDTQTVAFELVALPENNQEAAPGPTDYVSLVAVLNLSKSAASGDLPVIGKETFSGFPEAFIRRWMGVPIQEAFRSMANRSAKLKYLDIRKMVRRDVKKAVGVYLNDQTLLLYIEYVSP